MSKLFARNIDGTGRLVRGVMALGLFAAGAFLLRGHTIFGVVLFAAGGFVLFEALKGWCAFRACGIKTKW